MSPELAIAPPSVSLTPTARIAVPHRNARRSAQEQLEQATMLKEVFAMQDAVNHAAEEAAKQTHKGGPSQLRVLAPLDASALAPPAETLPFLHNSFRVLEDLGQMMYDVEEVEECTAPDEQSLAQSRLLELEELTAQVLSEDSFSLRRCSSAGISITELIASTFADESPWDTPDLDDHDGTSSYGFPSFYPSFGPSPSPVFSSILCGLADTKTQPLAGGLGRSLLKRNALPRTEWRPEEDEAIRQGVIEHGYKWCGLRPSRLLPPPPAPSLPSPPAPSCPLPPLTPPPGPSRSHAPDHPCLPCPPQANDRLPAARPVGRRGAQQVVAPQRRGASVPLAVPLASPLRGRGRLPAFAAPDFSLHVLREVLCRRLEQGRPPHQLDAGGGRYHRRLGPRDGTPVGQGR